MSASKLLQSFCFCLGVLFVGCGSKDNVENDTLEQKGDVAAADQEQSRSQNGNGVARLDEEPPDVEALAQLLEKYRDSDCEKFLAELKRLYEEHPDEATLIVDTYINRFTPSYEGQNIGAMRYGRAIAVVDQFSKLDPEAALSFAINSMYSTDHLQQVSTEALAEKGDIGMMISNEPLVTSDLARSGLIGAIGGFMDPEQLIRYTDWIEDLPMESRQTLMMFYKPEHFPRFEEFDEWALKDLLGDAIRPILAVELALRMENIANAEDAQAMLEEFEEIPGFTEADREVLERAWYDRYLQNDQDRVARAIPIMNDPKGAIAAQAAGKVYQDQSGKAAFDFIDQLPDERKDRGLRTVMFHWYRNDSKALSEHLLTISNRETRRLAGLHLAQLLERDNHDEEAEQWRSWAAQNEKE